MKPKNKSLYLVVGFIVIILIILAVVFTTMKKNNDIPDTEDSLPNETDNTEEVIDTNNDKDNFIDALISIDETVLTEQEKFELIDFGKRIFSPVYDPPVSLITETGLDLSAASSAPWTCVVTPDGDQTKTFYFQFNQKISASKFIWQVSFYPFSGGPTSVTDELIQYYKVVNYPIEQQLLLSILQKYMRPKELFSNHNWVDIILIFPRI